MTKQEAIEQLKFISKYDYHVDTKEAVDTIIFLLEESHKLKSKVEILNDKSFGQSLRMSELLDSIEDLKDENERMTKELRLSVNCKQLINMLEYNTFSAECFNNKFNNVEIGNLLCLSDIADVLEELSDWRR